MDSANEILERIKSFGVGRRTLGDDIFINDKPPLRLGIYDMDDETLCHEVVKTTCTVPGCIFTAESLLEYEDHYNCTHRYSCSQCRKMLPSPHFLDLHLQETHDSFFAVMAERKPSYSCYIEECKEKFMTPNDRHSHCVQIHKLPKDFRFEEKAKNQKKNHTNPKVNCDLQKTKEKHNIFFTTNKQKTFPKYTGRKFTKQNNNKPKNEEMDIVVDELRENLPQ